MADSDLETEENIPRFLVQRMSSKNHDTGEKQNENVKKKNSSKFPFELTGPVITRLSMAGGNIRTQTGELYKKVNKIFSEKIIDVLDDLVTEPNVELNHDDLKKSKIYKYNFRKIFKTKTPEKVNHILEIFPKQKGLREIRKRFLTLLNLYGIDINFNQKTLEYHLEEIDLEMDKDERKENVLKMVKKLINYENDFNMFISKLKQILKEKNIKFKLNTIYSEDYDNIMKNINNLNKYKYHSITTKSLMQERDYYIQNKNLLFSPFNTFKLQLKKFLEPFNIKIKDDFTIGLLYNMEQYLIEFFSKAKEIVEHANRETITVSDIELLEKLTIKK